MVLLKFLSQGSEPLSIAEDLDKIFDAISNVTFDKQDKKSQFRSIIEIKNIFGNDEEILVLDTPVIC